MKRLIFITLLASAVLCGCKKNREVVATPQVAPEVQTASALVKNIDVWNSYSARIEPVESVDLRARVGGYLDKVAFKKGDMVKEGDVLFYIDERPFQIALEAARATLKAAESKIFLCENNFRRAKGLYAKKAISEELFQTRQTELLVAKAKLAEAKSAERNAALNLDYSRIVAPISGRIGENLTDVGNLVTPNVSMLARILRTDFVKVYFRLNERDAMRYKNLGLLKNISVNKGPEVEVFQKNGSKKYTGKVTYFDNRLGEKTSSLLMCAEIANFDDGLMAGALADIKIKEDSIQNALFLPEDAVLTDQMGRYVLALGKGDIVKYVPVKVGRKFGKFLLVESGITPADKIIVVGIQRATVGGKVSPKQIELKAEEIK